MTAKTVRVRRVEEAVYTASLQEEGGTEHTIELRGQEEDETQFQAVVDGEMSQVRSVLLDDTVHLFLSEAHEQFTVPEPSFLSKVSARVCRTHGGGMAKQCDWLRWCTMA